VNAVNDPNIQLMIDYYHFEVEKEDPSDILKVKDHLRHLHMANPNGRVMPLKWEEYNYGPFFAVLRQIHYDRLISLEVSSSNLPAEGPQAIALLRRAFGSDSRAPEILQQTTWPIRPTTSIPSCVLTFCARWMNN